MKIAVKKAAKIAVKIEFDHSGAVKHSGPEPVREHRGGCGYRQGDDDLVA